MNATILTFHHGTHTQREVMLSKLHTKHGTIAYVTINAYGNNQHIFRRPTARYLVGKPKTMDIPELDMFLHVTNLIEHWQEIARIRIEDSVSYGIGHDGSDTAHHSESNVLLPDARDNDILKRLVKRQAQLAARIRQTVNQVQKAKVEA